MCQSQFWATNADSGSPIAPPTPSVALIAAIAVPVRCGGVISRISEMPTGMNPIASPCIARPTSIGASESLSAQTTLATSSSPALATSTRCLPKRSASRPATGIATAAASSVIVMTQAAFAWLVPRSSPSSPWIGIRSVCVSDAVRPPKHSTTTGSTGCSRRSRVGTKVDSSDTCAGYM